MLVGGVVRDPAYVAAGVRGRAVAHLSRMREDVALGALSERGESCSIPNVDTGAVHERWFSDDVS